MSSECKNFIICGNKTDSDDLCMNCWCLFGEWRDKNCDITVKNTNDTCPLCEQTNITTLYRMNCEHYVCVDCFKNIYIGQPFKNYKNITWEKYVNNYENGKYKIKCSECN
jgi:hypothetical protein